MRTPSVLLLSALLAFHAAACGSKDRAGASSTSTANYEVVSEGAASGVAPTIGGSAGVPPPMTATNIDTTTNLEIVADQPLATGTAGNLAGTLPSTTSMPGGPVYVPPSDPTGVMRRTPPAQGAPPVQRVPPVTRTPVPVPRPAPPPAPEPAPPTETAEPEPAPEPTTDTTSTEEQEEEPPPPPPEQTDTTTTNPGR